MDWPPGPADRAEWERIIAARPDLAPATIEPEFCLLANGISSWLGKPGAYRVDQLRALGNAVVPSCGAVAFLILLNRLKEALKCTT